MGHTRHLPCVIAVLHIFLQEGRTAFLPAVKTVNFFFRFLLFPKRKGKGRAAFQILPQIHIQGEKLSVQRHIVRIGRKRKIQKDLIAVSSGGIVHEISFCLIIFRQLFIQTEGIRKRFLQNRKRMGKLGTVIIQLHHFLHPFELQDLGIRQPFGKKDFIRRLIRIMDLIFRSFLMHIRTFQNL